MKPADWPRYMIAKRLKTGEVAYYWNPPIGDLKAGFPLTREALGSDYGAASHRARALNKHLHDWRAGRDNIKDLDLRPGFGTLGWLVERYYHSRAFAKVSARCQPDYRRELNLALDVTLNNGQQVRTLQVQQVTARFADKLYDKILKGPKGPRRRTANLCISRLRRAWSAVQRLYPKVVPPENPFEGVEMEGGSKARSAATRAEAVALSAAIREIGHPHLALVPLICFELLQRPENVLAGHLTWGDWKPAQRPNAVQIIHHKTGEQCWHTLSDELGPLYPELEKAIDSAPRLGVAIVLKPAGRGRHLGPPKPYDFHHARSIVRDARKAAELPDHVTLDACRHGGMTELGDAEITEAEVMALSGHKTPDAARLYIKRTELQRQRAARKRCAWREDSEQNESKIQNRAQNADSE